MAAPAETPAGTGRSRPWPSGGRRPAIGACGRVGPQISARFFSKACDTRADLTRTSIGGVLSPVIWPLVLVKALTRGPGCAPCKLFFIGLTLEAIRVKIRDEGFARNKAA